MVDSGQIKDDELRRLNIYNLYKFTGSNIAKRMCQAQANNKLFRSGSLSLVLKRMRYIKNWKVMNLYYSGYY